MADRVKAQEMLLSEQLWSKLTTGEQISVMRVSWGMSPWIDDSSCINFQYWDSAVVKYMAQELDLEPAGYRDLESTEVLEPSLLHSENPDLQSKMVSENPCNKSLEDSLQKLKEAMEEWKASSSQLVDEFKKYREEIEATEQVTDSCEDCVVPLKENTNLFVNMQPDSDACNVFDKMPIEKIGASLNLGTNSRSQEKLGDIPAMNSSIPGQENVLNPEIEDVREVQIQLNSFKVIPDSAGDNEIASVNMDLLIDCEIRWGGLKANSFDFLAIPAAQEPFDERSERSFNEIDYSVHVSNALLQMGNWVFDPGSAKFDGLQGQFESCYAVIFDGNSQGTDVSAQSSVDVNAFEYDCFGANLKGSRNWIVCAGNSNSIMANGEPILMPFDRGKLHTLHSYFSWEVQSNGIFFNFGLFKQDGIMRAEISNQRLQWDPGGVSVMIVLLRFLESWIKVEIAQGFCKVILVIVANMETHGRLWGENWIFDPGIAHVDT